MLDVTARAPLRAIMSSFAGDAVVSVRRTCSDSASEVLCRAVGSLAPLVVGTLDPGRYVVSVQYPGAGPAGTQGNGALLLGP